MPLAATWMDLEMLTLNEVSQRRRNIIGHPLYVGSKKKCVTCNLFTKLKETHGLSKVMATSGGKLGGCGGRGRRMERNSQGVWDGHVHTAIFRADKPQGIPV